VSVSLSPVTAAAAAAAIGGICWRVAGSSSISPNPFSSYSAKQKYAKQSRIH
jgi:hypothetical protein